MKLEWLRIVRAWRRGGVALATRVVGDRLADAVLERRMGIRSRGLVPIESLLEHWRDCHDYFPTSIRAFSRALAELQISERDVFVDYGCGMGRVLVLAAGAPFSQLIGVEVSADLLRCAERNVQAALGAHHGRVLLVHCDAREYRLPDTATVLYFYNPFHGEILRSVLADVERSLRECPRELCILFNNPAHLVPLEAEYPWLRRVREYRFEYAMVLYSARAG